MSDAYPANFADWPLDRRNAFFADAARTYDSALQSWTPNPKDLHIRGAQVSPAANPYMLCGCRAIHAPLW